MQKRKRRRSHVDPIPELKRLLAEPGPHSLLWYHRIGMIVNGLNPGARAKYGAYMTLLESLVDSFDSAAGSRDSKLHTLRSVIDKSSAIAAVYSPARLRRFERPPKGSFPLRWSHLRLIAALDASDRQHFEKMIVNHGWSVPRLQLEIRRRRGRTKAGGRKHRRVRVDQAVQQLAIDCETWTRKANSHWLDEEAPAVTVQELRGFCKNSPAEVAQALATLRRLRATAGVLIKRLKDTDANASPKLVRRRSPAKSKLNSKQ